MALNFHFVITITDLHVLSRSLTFPGRRVEGGGGGGGGGYCPFQAVYSRIGYINQSLWV